MTRLAHDAPSIEVPTGLLTVTEYLALGDEAHLRNWELQEGNVVMTPAARPAHNNAGGELYVQLRRQLPGTAIAIFEIDVDLELVASDRPGTVRQPDLAVVTRNGYDRTRRDGGILRAAEILLAVEIVSPGSARMDRIVKRHEYADAGIPHYWVLDLDPQPSLVVHRLTDVGRYEVGGPLTGIVRLDAPFPFDIDLSALA